eukprot:7056857-Pyramimonas_sp.AAC.1
MLPSQPPSYQVAPVQSSDLIRDDAGFRAKARAEHSVRAPDGSPGGGCSRLGNDLAKGSLPTPLWASVP